MPGQPRHADTILQSSGKQRWKDLNLRTNVIASVAEVCINGLVLFFLFRLLARSIGLEFFGIWSIVATVVSVARVADLGITSGVLRYISAALAHNDTYKAAVYIETSIISIGLFFALVCLCLYYPLILAFGQFLPASALQPAKAILPYALLSFWLTGIASIGLAALIGAQCTYLKCILSIISSLVLLSSSVLLVPNAGIVGIVQAQVLQALAMSLGAWIITCVVVPNLNHFPRRWRRTEFKEILAYSTQLQIISIAYLVQQPIAKLLLAHFGGLSEVAIFEMATRLVAQVRALIVAANQALIPAFANLNERSAQRLNDLYWLSSRTTAAVALPLTAVLISATPMIAELWLGSLAHNFVLFTVLIAIGSLVNTMSVPAYFLGIGMGRIFWNVVSDLTVPLGLLLLGLPLGYSLGPTGVIVSGVIVVSIASGLVLERNHRLQSTPFKTLVSRDLLLVAVGASIAAVCGVVTYVKLRAFADMMPAAGASAIVLVLALAWPVWRHPDFMALFQPKRARPR